MRAAYALALSGLAVLAPRAGAADYCCPHELQGPYGFQLSGKTAISGDEAPVAAVGRIVFGEDGSISGVASVNFKGYFLGNPVTGDYVIHSDCGVSFSLQDDSGAFQGFRGRVTPGGSRMVFQQVVVGLGVYGVMQKTPEKCVAADFQGRYALTLSGAATPFAPENSPKRVLEKGRIEADGNGQLKWLDAPSVAAGAYNLDSDCFAQIEITMPAQNGGDAEHVNLRGIVVMGGKEVLAIQTDPQDTSTARFIRQRGP